MSTVLNSHRVTMSAGELAELRTAVRHVCTRHAGADEARRLVDDTPTGRPKPQLWTALTAELGIGGLVVPARFGGADAGWAAVRVVLEELGRELAAAPFRASTVQATELLLATGDDDACSQLLPGIADGHVLATVGVAERSAGWDDWAHDAAPTTAAVTARREADRWLLSGGKRAVPHGTDADLFLVTGSADGATAIFAVERGAPGIEATALPTLDGTRPVADVTLAGTPARLIGAAGGSRGSGAAVRRALDLGGLAVAAEDVGAMRACLEMSVEYALLRRQFDRAIGSFQAVKHKLADMLVRVELAEAAVEQACLALDEGDATASAAAVAAHACAAESFRLVAAETIQTHGGIGFTWEHPAHLYFRRAKSSQLAFGGVARYRERLLDRLGLVGAG